jgi:hypothetical protein
MDSEDPVFGVTRQALVQIEMVNYNATYVGANRLLLTSVPVAYSVSSTDKVYATTIPADSLVRDTLPDGTVKSSGIYSISLTFNAAGMVSGDFVLVQCILYFFSDLNYLKTYQSHPVGFETAMGTAFNFCIYHS